MAGPRSFRGNLAPRKSGRPVTVENGISIVETEEPWLKNEQRRPAALDRKVEWPDQSE